MAHGEMWGHNQTTTNATLATQNTHNRPKKSGVATTKLKQATQEGGGIDLMPRREVFTNVCCNLILKEVTSDVYIYTQ
jgi:hypothetical protein